MHYLHGGIMAELDEFVYKQLKVKTGLPLQYIIKEQKLFEVFSQIMLHNTSTAKLDIIMKGGTALNRIYLKENQRFSEDIDFDYVSEEKNDTKIENLKKLMRDIKDFEIDGPWKYYSTIRFHCIYSYKGQKNHIRVEYALKNRIETAEPVASEGMVSSVYGTTIIGVRCYAFDDLVARKLNALANRCAGRDIWDCYYALPKTKNIKRAVSKMLESEKSKLSVKDFFSQATKKLESANVKELLKDTNQYIPIYLRPKNWQDIISSLIAQIELIEK